MKFRIRFFITLFMLLLSGYGQLNAHNPQQHFDYSTAIKSGEFLASDFDGIQSEIRNYTSCHVEKLNDKTYSTDNETEENELTSSKKWLELNGYFAAFFYAQVQNHSYHTIKKCLPLGEPTSIVPSCKRYIMFRVIRI